MVQGKEKGNEWEREVGRKLSSWLTDGESETELIRSMSSGGWVRRGYFQVGDLAPNGTAGAKFRLHFAIECKHQKPEEVDWWKIFSSEKYSFFVNEWQKLVTETQRANDKHGINMEPLFIVKANFRPPVIGFYPGLYTPPVSVRCITIESTSMACRFIRFDEFLSQNPEHYYQRWRALHST